MLAVEWRGALGMRAVSPGFELHVVAVAAGLGADALEAGLRRSDRDGAARIGDR